MNLFFQWKIYTDGPTAKELSLLSCVSSLFRDFFFPQTFSHMSEICKLYMENTLGSFKRKAGLVPSTQEKKMSEM